MRVGSNGIWWVLGVVLCAGAVPALAEDDAAINRRKSALYSALDFQGLTNSIGVALLQDPFPESRRMAARVLASDADPARLRLLTEYAGDTDAWTRYRTMLAAGRMGPPGLGLALRGLRDSAPVVRQAAVWAACHGGNGGFEPVTQLLLTEYDDSVVETALANLWRFTEQPWEAHAAAFVGHDKPGYRRAAAASLARSERATRSQALRRLVADGEPVIRATALAGYRRGPVVKQDAEVIQGALWDGDWRVQAEACAVLAARDDMEVSEDTAKSIVKLWTSDRGQLAVPALRAAGRHRTIGRDETLQSIVETGEAWPAAEALQAMARRGSKQWQKLATAWFESDHRWRRRAAARAVAIGAGHEPTGLERRAQSDPDPAVRLAYLETLGEEVVPRRRDALWAIIGSDSDPMVRAQCVDLLADAGELKDPARAMELYRAWGGDDAGDARAAALLAALDLAREVDRRGIVEIAAADRNRQVAAMAVNRGRELGIEGSVFSGDPRHGQRWYQDLVAWVDDPRWLDVVTVRGTLRIKLELGETPITSREVWDLAERGFYDGLEFHRVVPNFVVQGGDPRGDGWGGPGFVIPDEPSVRPFDSWRVGIATSGPQTGGSQFFFMLLPSDRLAGHYTNFGEVVAGRDVLTRIQVGDEIVRVDTHTGTEPPPPVPVLTGPLTWDDLSGIGFWEAERAEYAPDPKAIEQLRSVAGAYRVITVLGTWCSDSEREVPRLERVLEDVGGDRFEHVMVGVDRTKRIADAEVASAVTGGEPVDRVPTIVLFDETGTELGRIVETADRPIEELMALFVAPVEGW